MKGLVVLLVVIIAIVGVYFIFWNGDDDNGLTAVPTNTEDCENLVNLEDYCAGLSEATVVYLPKGRTVSTGNGATATYDGNGTGACSWSQTNAQTQPLTQEETDNFKSFGLNVAFYNNENIALQEFEDAAQRSNTTTSYNQFSVIGNLSAIPNYPFEDRILFRHASQLNINLIQFYAKGLSAYCSPSEEQALLNAFD